MSRRGSALPAAIRAIPRRSVSRAVGCLARLPVPRLVLTPALRLYARVYGADLGEAARGVAEYRTFLDFFTRRLRAGARPMPEDADLVVSPADGRVHAAGRVEAGTLLQAKGVTYRLDALLGGAEEALAFEGGTQLTVYLSPGDYHRFHWPATGRIHTLRHLPGDLWPVHERAAAALPGLFAANERVVTLGTLESGATFGVVAVGALDVGSIRLAGLPVRTNRGAPARVRTWTGLDLPVRRGEEMGHFELGSTLVVLLDRAAGTLDVLPSGARVRVGDGVGRLRTQAA